MAKVTRQEARDMLFGLLFETEFHEGENPTAVYELACADREIPSDKYIRETFFGVISKREILDAVISVYSKGWRADRLSGVSRTIIRIATYEMLFIEDIPMNVSISQAVELAVKYGEDRAKQFVNGVLSGMFKDVEAKGVQALIDEAVAAIEAKTVAAQNADEKEAEGAEAAEAVAESDNA